MLITLILMFFFRFAMAGEPLVEGWTSVRALGMGNAFTAVVNDSDSLFYNPAGLCKASGFTWVVADPHAGANNLQIMEVVKEFQGTESLATFLDGQFGKTYWLGGGAKTAFVIPCFGFGLFTNAETNLAFHNPAYPTFEPGYYGDYGYAAGFGFPMFPGVWYMGFNVRRVNRTGTNTLIGPETLGELEGTAIQDRLKNRGWGWSGDVGTNFTLPGPVKPTLSFVWKNAGGTTFTHDEGLAAPPSIRDEMVIGASLEVSVPFVSIIPSIDYKYFNRPDVQVGKKLHMGVELNLFMLSVRAGLNQGYYTIGAGVDMGFIKADVASYGVELGEYPGQLEDRRIVGQLTLEFGFDGGSLFGSSSGKGGSGGSGGAKRPRLKQRR